MLYNLHLLRVIAALGVVYFHTTSTAGLGLDWDVGSRGVDVFFVISGFIIAYIGTSKPEQFFVRRLIRVVPFYWAATLFVFALAAAAPALFHTTTADVPHLLASLAFLPHEAASGEMVPTLVLGWSLNYEMFFYVWFALSLRLSSHSAPRQAPLVCIGWLIALMLAIRLTGATHPVSLFYARPIVLEFCYGILAFYAFQWCSARRDRLARIPALKWLLALVLVGNLVAIAALEERYRDTLPRHLVAGIPSFFVITSALLLERVFGVATKNRLIYLLGEASYIIYLVHPYVIFTVLRVVFKHAGTASSPVLAALIAGLLVLTSAIAIAIHLWFEKPVMAFLRARLT